MLESIKTDVRIQDLFPVRAKKIYLAAPFFTDDEKMVYNWVIKALRNAGYEVYVPMEHEIPHAWELPNWMWGSMVFNEDINAIKDADAVLVLNWNMYSDSGTAWEQGYAFGLGKPVVSILVNVWAAGRDMTYSLMMVNGCDTAVPLSCIIPNLDDVSYEIEQK